jgi:hypothetical protein
MKEDFDENDPDQYCGIAVDEAFGICLSPEQAFRQAARLFGLSQAEINNLFPIEEVYSDIIDEGLSDSKCVNRTELVSWVLARAWQLFVEDGVPSIMTSFERAWSEARYECGDFGIGV